MRRVWHTLNVCHDHKYCLCAVGEDGSKDCPLHGHNLPLRNVVASVGEVQYNSLLQPTP